MQEHDTGQSTLEDAGTIAARQPDWFDRRLLGLQRILPGFLRPWNGLLFSFKNRILFSTLFVLIGAVIGIGVILQFTVFPQLRGDEVAVWKIKTVHFLLSILIIGLSWVFVELISKKMTLPLLELTKRADQISREAGAKLAKRKTGCADIPEPLLEEPVEKAVIGDEISQLTSSFNRMLVHLRASEARLRESEEKYRFLFDNAPSPIFVIDGDDMRILDVNARAVEEYQYPREELLMLGFEDLGLDRDRERTGYVMKRLFPTEVTVLPVLQHRRQDGSIFMVNFQARLSSYCNKPAIIAAVWDVTENLERHAKLIQAGKMATLGEMATGIAHELNQPLNVIRLGCDYLVKRIKSGRELSLDEMAKVHSELVSSVDRASRIINHLRQFGRKAEDTMTPIDINEPILSVFTLLGTQLSARGIRWELHLAPDLPRILGDGNRLEQVFINLVLNAKDALLSAEPSPRPGAKAYGTPDSAHTDLPPARHTETEKRLPKVVIIRSAFEDERVVVTVSDTGPGVPEDLQSKVFEPFFTTKETGQGTGLGLSISYGIVKEQQGTIELEPTTGPGATFRLTFPGLKTEISDDQNPVGR